MEQILRHGRGEGDASPPRHVAIIMDGNGRWAQRRGLPRLIGHRHGAEAVRRTVQAASDLGIGYLTLFGFSSENWLRPESEVAELMRLLRFYLRREVAELHEKAVRIRFIGNRQRLARDIVALMENAEELTHRNAGLVLTVALSYGGRDEILRAARHLAEEVAAGRLAAEALTEEHLGQSLESAALPDPDLMIRTSGEKRISNFLLWQLAYSEMVFTDTLWPDFGHEDLAAAVKEFRQRDRRYGAKVG